MTTRHIFSEAQSKWHFEVIAEKTPPSLITAEKINQGILLEMQAGLTALTTVVSAICQ